MSRSVKEPLLSVALPQQEGTRSFAVESEEAVALPSEPSAIPLSPLHDPQSYAAAKQQGGGSSSSSGMLSSASAGQSATQPVSSTKQQLQQQQSSSSYRERRPERQRDGGSGGGAAANHTTASASRHAAAAASAGGGPAGAGGRRASTRVLTSCSADTPAAQRAAEEEASRDVDFNPVILCPLQNLGNTCYFNSGVQLLANCPALVYGLRNSPLAPSWSSSSPAGRATTRLCARGGVATHALFTDFAALLSRMENNNLSKGESLSPVRALDALATVHSQFEGRSQQDAAEMMTAVLASLAEEGGQYAEVTELLKSFTNDASATASTAAVAFPAPAAAAAAAASSTPSGHSRSAEPYVVDDFSQPSPQHSQNGAPSSSLPSPNKSGMNSSAGARSAHELAMLRFMQQVNSENEELERRVKQRQGKPYTGTFRAPRLHFNPVMDGFRGYSVSQVECHHCHCVSRTVSEYNALLLDVPTSRERSHFAARHPRLRRLAPDGAPLQAKKQAGFTWWNPLSFFTSFWDSVTRLFSSSVSFPLTLQECLDIHFEPVKLQGSNKYRCDSCGTTSEATKSESLLGLPEYLVLHMKRFEAGRCFNGKKTDPVIFPASWKSLTPAAAARAKLSGAPPEILDLRRYLHPVAAPYAEPIPRCLRGCLGGAVLEGEEEEEDTDVAGSRSNRKRQGGDQRPSSPSSPHPHPQTANALAAARSPAGRQGAAAPALTPSADGTTPWAMPTTYTLDGIVNHHGGYEGGHYTVYLYKATAEQQTWVYVSDDEIEKASAGEVADSEEYVLLYRRQPIVQPPPESNEGELLRQKACYYLSLRAGGPGSPSAAGAAAAAMVESSDAAVPSSSSASVTSTSSSPTYQPYVYISRMWLQRVAFLHEPGPIVNRLCYCRPEEQNKLTMYTTLFPRDVAVPAEVPHVHGPPVDWFYVPVTQTDYNIFYDAFGGNAAVTAAEVDAIRGMQEKFAEAIAAAERAKTGSKPSMRQMNRR